MTNDYAQMLTDSELSEFVDDPRPGWAGPALLFGARYDRIENIQLKTDTIVAGVPFDATASSRSGASEGPTAIRQASLVFSSYVDSLGEHDMLDMRTDEKFRYRRRDLVDVGDLHIYPTNTEKTFRAVATEVRKLASVADMLILLGGDHSISFPTFAGWRAAQLAINPDVRLGYVQIDHHFDFGDTSSIHGKLYHGSNARRISELPDMQPRNIAFIGQGSVTRAAQFDGLLKDGFRVVPARTIQADGPSAALSSTVNDLRRDCNAVYVSLDIDVLDSSVAPGTGNVTLGGLNGGELLDTIEILSSLPLSAFDIAEVAPRYDAGGRTAQIAARILFELLYRQPCEAKPAKSTQLE